jgi:transcriptional regulator with XRE-family HTH domain
MTASKLAKLATLAERLRFAIEAEGHSPTSVERTLRFSQGQMSRFLSGSRGVTTIDPDKMRVLADYLHVRFEWLVLGRGAMRRDGRETPTPAEEAIGIVRRCGYREEAIQQAWERFQSHEKDWNTAEWVLAIDSEARVFDRTLSATSSERPPPPPPTKEPHAPKVRRPRHPA